MSDLEIVKIAMDSLKTDIRFLIGMTILLDCAIGTLGLIVFKLIDRVSKK